MIVTRKLFSKLSRTSDFQVANFVQRQVSRNSLLTTAKTMVLSVIKNFQLGLKYRGGWWNLIEHMYTVRTNLLIRLRLNSLIAQHIFRPFSYWSSCISYSISILIELLLENIYRMETTLSSLERTWDVMPLGTVTMRIAWITLTDNTDGLSLVTLITLIRPLFLLSGMGG